MKTLLTALLLSLSVSTLWAQETSAPLVVLDRYTVGADGAAGRLKLLSGDDTPLDFTLTGKSKKHFEIRSGGVLALKKKPAGKKWWDVTVSFQKDGKKQVQEFRIVRDEFVKNKVIAHRGAWKNTGATENSLASLRHAIRLGCEGSEFDVRMSADSVLFIHHDATMGKVSIDKSAAADLHRLKLSNGEPLPLLEAYLQEGMTQNRTRLILEIKPSSLSKEHSLTLARLVVATVQKQKAQGWVDYISFDYDVLKEVLRLDPYAKVSYLEGDVPPQKVAADKMYGLDYPFPVFQKNPGWIAEARKQGLTVNVWTVNDDQKMNWLLEQNVDFITTNEPERLLQKVGAPTGN